MGAQSQFAAEPEPARLRCHFDLSAQCLTFVAELVQFRVDVAPMIYKVASNGFFEQERFFACDQRLGDVGIEQYSKARNLFGEKMYIAKA